MAESNDQTGAPAARPGPERRGEPGSGERLPITDASGILYPADAEVHRRLRELELENAELKRCQHDLAALVRAQVAELRQAHTLAYSAREAKRVFLSNLSHEVRTPLNVIQGLVHLLGLSLSDPATKERLALIREAGQQLLQLFNDLIELARVEPDGVRATAAGFDPEVLLEEVRTWAAARVLAKGLAFAADWAWLPPRLTGDPQRLRQVFAIYLDNALKFTDRGAVRLTATLLEEDTREVLVRFAVSDTGSGVPPDLRLRLFDAFEQGDASTTRRHGGVGLGLALARSLARGMGGDTGVEDNPAGGSTFWFTARLGLPPGEPVPPTDLLCDLRRRAGSGGPR